MYFYKKPLDIQTFTVSFTDTLDVTESILQAGLTLTITNLQTDGDSTSSLYIDSSLSVTDDDVSFRLQGGDDDNVYRILVSTGAVTASSNVYVKTNYLYVSAEEQSLVSLEEIKTYLDIPVVNYDAILLSLLRASDRAIYRITGRRFLYATYTDLIYLDEASDRIKLTNFPVDNIQSILVDGVTLDATLGSYSTYIAEREGYVHRVDGIKFPVAPVPIAITYKAGYKQVPEDVKLVAMKLVSAGYNARQQEGVKQESIGSYSVTYRDDFLLTSDSSIAATLNRYIDRSI